MEANTVYAPTLTVEAVTPGELVKKHMADPNHKITEELLRNVVVGVVPATNTGNQTN